MLFVAGIKKPDDIGLFQELFCKEARLFNLGFLVHHVLADSWIKFFDLELACHGAFVFGGRVKMTGTRTRH
jgi:hypothetical protein